MPSILTHAALPLIAGWALGQERISKRLVTVGMIAAVVPDLDVIGFGAGIPYDAPAGHRGISHSLAFGLLLGGLASSAANWLKAGRLAAFLFVTFAAASHGLTDMLTDGGRGVAFWWPFSEARLFLPERPLDVASIGFRGFLTGTIWGALWSELRWLIMPALALALLYRGWAGRHIDLPKGET